MSTARPERLAVAAAVLAASGCAAVAGYDDLHRECPPETPDCARAGSGANAGSGAAAGSAGTAPRQGTKMAQIERPDKSFFWIDVTEVTQAQYAAFLASSPAPNYDELCTAEGEQKREDCPEQQDAGADDLPQTCVDWCEARAYCTSVSKQLCGDSLVSSIQSDYYLACSRPGPTDVGVQPACGNNTCNVDGRYGGVQPAGVIADCYVFAADGQTEIHDLIGNVAEWTEKCELAQEDTKCATRGGSYTALSCCSVHVPVPRRKRSPTVGFRCCAYP